MLFADSGPYEGGEARRLWAEKGKRRKEKKRNCWLAASRSREKRELFLTWDSKMVRTVFPNGICPPT